MSPVGGSRHYGGAGLGQVGLWGCPSCGEDNTGPMEQGCTHCGAGQPGKRAEPPPAPPTLDEPVAPPAAPPAAPQEEPPQEFTAWAAHHPDATIEQAYIAGYIEGIRDARRAQLAAQPPAQEAALPPQDKAIRTLVAALALFRDQILADEPEEVATGEWCNAAEATALIAKLQQEEPVHG